jgi:myotubularin-related protein 5/13
MPPQETTVSTCKSTHAKFTPSPLAERRFSVPLIVVSILVLEEVEFSIPSGPSTPSDAKTLERLSERSYVRDWGRLGLCPDTPASVLSNGTMSRQRTDPFRITTVNYVNMVCQRWVFVLWNFLSLIIPLVCSYPAMLVVPYNVTDDSIRRLTRCHRHSRIPVITWRHAKTKALLLRGAGFHGKGVIGMFKGHPTTTGKFLLL